MKASISILTSLLVLSLVAWAQPPFEPDEFTRGLWHFDEDPSTYVAFDASGNGYNMGLESGAEFTPDGHFEGAVDLTEPEAKVNSGWLIGNSWDALTIDAFIYPTAITGPEHPIVERYRWHNVADPSYYLSIMADGSLYGGIYLNEPGSVYSSAQTEPGTIVTNEWYHVAMTWSTGEPTRIFVNGEMIAESGQIHDGTIRAGNDPLTIGWFHDEGYGDFFFQGKIDEVRISNIVRYGGEPPPPGALFDDFEDGDWTSNPTWTSITGYGVEMGSNGHNNSDWCVEVYENASPNVVGILSTPFEVQEAFTMEVWVKRRPNQNERNYFRVIVTEGPYSQNGGFYLYYGHLQQQNIVTIWMDGVIIAEAPIVFGDDWTQIRMIRSEMGTWDIFWNDALILEDIQDTFGTLANAHFNIEAYGHYNQGGIFFDDVMVTSEPTQEPPFEPDEFTRGLWHFDEDPSTYVAFDASGNGYNMGLESGAEFTPDGHFDGAVDLTEPEAKVNSGWLIGNGWEAITIDAFIYPTAITGPEHPIVERYRWHNVADPSYYLSIMADGSLYGGIYLNEPGSVYSSAQTEPGTIVTNEWYHVAMTWSTGEPTRIFVNGEMIAESSQIHDGTIRAGNDPLTIGWFHDEGYGDFFFQGKIDEVRISNIVRYGGEPPPIELAMTPYNPPIVIPPGGDAFAYNIAGGNNTPEAMEFDLWTSILMPNGSAFILLGPLHLELEGGEFLERDRAVFVPEMAPPGEYFCSASVGLYPWEIWTMDGFEFFKEGPGDGSNYNLNGWIESGEPFPGESGHAALIPTEFSLQGAYPNPFNPSTTIRYDLPEAQKVTLSIYDVSGRLVTKLIDGWRNAGQHEAVFDATGLSSGMYLYRIRAGDYSAVEKMVLMK